MRAAITNALVGEIIGMSHAGVSRLRSGHRHPSIPTMVRIARKFGWTVEEQVALFSPPGAYAAKFEAILVNAYGVAAEPEPANA